MTRGAFGGFILALVVGCQGQPTNVNPFAPYGPTQIPPPPTGTAGRNDPYYRRSLAERDPLDANRLSQVPRTGRTVVTSDTYRSDAALADRRSSSVENDTRDARRTNRGRADGTDRSSYDQDEDAQQLREAQLNWQRPSMAYRDRNAGVRSGMVRPRFGGYGDSDLLDEPPTMDSGLARNSGQLRGAPLRSGWSSGGAPGVGVAERATNGWNR